MQYIAEASQKFTWPALTIPDADVTAAVSVIVLPAVIFAALPEAAVMVNAVVVAAPVAATAVAVKPVVNAIAKTPVKEVRSGATKYRCKNPGRKKFPVQRHSIVRPLSDGSYNSVRDENANGPNSPNSEASLAFHRESRPPD